MEQQRISIAKAGIVCSLSARTAVIAAANPVHGHYDKCKTIGENLKMAGPLLSRFDLIFILVDKSDRHKDRMLAKHIIGMHSKHKKATTTNQKHRASSSSSSSSASAARGGVIHATTMAPKQMSNVDGSSRGSSSSAAIVAAKRMRMRTPMKH